MAAGRIVHPSFSIVCVQDNREMARQLQDIAVSAPVDLEQFRIIKQRNSQIMTKPKFRLVALLVGMIYILYLYCL